MGEATSLLKQLRRSQSTRAPPGSSQSAGGGGPVAGGNPYHGAAQQRTARQPSQWQSPRPTPSSASGSNSTTASKGSNSKPWERASGAKNSSSTSSSTTASAQGGTQGGLRDRYVAWTARLQTHPTFIYCHQNATGLSVYQLLLEQLVTWTVAKAVWDHWCELDDLQTYAAIFGWPDYSVCVWKTDCVVGGAKVLSKDAATAVWAGHHVAMLTLPVQLAVMWITYPFVAQHSAALYLAFREITKQRAAAAAATGGV